MSSAAFQNGLDCVVDRDESAELAEQNLKDALARVASSVAIVACWNGDTPSGLLISSLTALSVRPGRMLFSVRRDASAYSALIDSGRCEVTILSLSDLAEANLFSSSAGAERRFTSRKWRLDDTFAPRFSGGVSSFDLIIEEQISAEQYTIFIASVAASKVRAGAPLVYFDRELHPLAQVVG